MKRKRKDPGTILTPRTKNPSLTGDTTEKIVVDIMKSFDSVCDVRRDRYSSKFDVYYELEGESVTRGLQVKTINQKSRDFYHINSMHKYEEGMLVIAARHPRFGFVYTTIESDKDANPNVYVSLNKKEKSKYEKLILMWPEFLVELERSLTKGIIVTPELFKSSICPSQYLEYQSIERFKIFCEKHDLKLDLVDDVSLPTDLYVNGFKVQMKYSSKPTSHLEASQRNGDYYYPVNLRRFGNVKYVKGDNDFYVIEMGEHLGEFLFVPEYILLEKKYISQGPLEKARSRLRVFPYDYVEKRKATATTGQKNKIKGNWSCNKWYWMTTEEGCLGSTNDVAIHIENLFMEGWMFNEKK